jgi:ADP-heptose:LPS heptosyltransferase
MHFPLLRLLRHMDVGTIVVYGPQATVGLVKDNDLADYVVPETKKPGIFELSRTLRRHAPARCICFPKSLRPPVAAWLAGVPERIGVTDGCAAIFNTHHSPFWSVNGFFVHRYREAMVKRWPSLPPLPFSDYIPSVQVDRPEKGYVCLIPGSAWPPKSWPVDRFRRLAAIAVESGLDVMVLGTPHEADLGDTILEGLGDRGRNLCGHTDLPQAAAWLHGAVAAIGNDSGLSHLAAACGTKTIAIFGPTDPTASAPWGPDSTALRPQDLPCEPCFKNGCTLAEKECLIRTTPEAVWECLWPKGS